MKNNNNKFDIFVQLTVIAEGAIVWATKRLGYDNIKDEEMGTF